MEWVDSNIHTTSERGLSRIRLRLKCDGTRAETRFRLSPKRTSPFKSAEAIKQESRNKLLDVWSRRFRIECNLEVTPQKILHIYTVSQEECARLREGVPYVKVYRYNPKHLCPNFNGYGDNGQRSLKL